jgi:hypothetical protein
MDVAAWLHDRGFDRYARIFEDNDIDDEVLVTLTEADLKELGVWSLGHRRKLMAAIAGLRSSAPPSTADVAPAAARLLARRQFGVVAVAPPPSDGVSSDLLRRASETTRAVVVDHGGAVDTPAEGGMIAVFGSGKDTDGQVDCAIQAAAAIKEAVRDLEDQSGTAMPIDIVPDAGQPGRPERRRS